jgi:hypothetical protein
MVLSPREDQSLVMVLSALLLEEQFMMSWKEVPPMIVDQVILVTEI